jgi:NTP pyrophosphatase (non-canonical NTP hydrolase)
MSGKIHELDAAHHGAQLHLDKQSAPEIKAMIAELIADRDSRGWQHDLKNLAMGLNVEAGEVLDIYTWKDTGESLSDAEAAHTAEELADVLIYVFDMCAKLDLDPLKIMRAKQAINATRHRGAKA